MRGKNLVKMLKALEMLSKAGGVTIRQLTDGLGVDRRSVYRILSTLQELGFPIWEEKPPLEKEKRWQVEDGYMLKLPNIHIPDLQFNMAELLSLFLIRGEAGLISGTAIEKHVNSAFGKIGQFVPELAVQELRRMRSVFLPHAKFMKDYSGAEGLIITLTECILSREVCDVIYHAFYRNEERKYRIRPLHFFEHQGGLYLLLMLDDSQAVRTFAVERIRELRPTGETFEYPMDFDPHEFLSSSFDMIGGEPISVKVWFHQDVARYIRERTWVPDQKIRDGEDGSIVLEMETSGWEDVKKWVLSHGKNAEIIEPLKMREEIAVLLADMVRRYEEDMA